MSDAEESQSSEASSETETTESICNECMKVFSSISKLNRHLKEQHANEQSVFPCRSCEKVFRRKEHLKRHERGHHLGDKVQCPLCSSRFVENCKLMKHLLEKHEVYKCSRCSAVLKTRDPQTHVCEAGFAFPEASYKCKFCDRSYKRKGYLVKHIEQLHSKTSNNFSDVVAELQRLETPSASIGKSLYSDKCEMYEYEIGLEYDVKGRDGTVEKKDIFSGVIKLPKIMGYNKQKNLIFGKVEIGKRIEELIQHSTLKPSPLKIKPSLEDSPAQTELAHN